MVTVLSALLAAPFKGGQTHFSATEFVIRRMFGSLFIHSCLIAIFLVLPVSFLSGQQPPARVVVATVVEREVATGNVFVATILPLKRAVIGSAVDGRVVERNVDVGDRVKQNQPLVQLLTNTIELERKAAVAELKLRNHELSELENGFLPNEIEQAKAKMLAAEAKTKYAEILLGRVQRLKDSMSQGDLDAAEAARDDASQTFLDMTAAYDLVTDGPRKEKIEQFRAMVEMQQAQVDQINDRIEKYTIISRFDGYVVAQHVEVGAWVKIGDPIVEVIALDEVELQAQVAEQHVAHIQPGMEVRIEVPSVPDRIFSGVVKSVVPQADTQARTFPVVVRVKNEITTAGPLLKSGLYARVEMPTGARQNAVMVPKDALVLGGPKPVVFVIEAGNAAGGSSQTESVSGNNPTGSMSGKAVPIPVELGVAMDSLIQVKGNLQAGQRIVIEGNERLRSGQEVVIVGEK